MKIMVTWSALHVALTYYSMLAPAALAVGQHAVRTGEGANMDSPAGDEFIPVQDAV